MPPVKGSIESSNMVGSLSKDYYNNIHYFIITPQSNINFYTGWYLDICMNLIVNVKHVIIVTIFIHLYRYFHIHTNTTCM